MGAVSFLHRFGSSLNPHFHYHLCVVDGLFEKVQEESDPIPAHPETSLSFHETTALTHELLNSLQHTVRSRVLRQFIELSSASFDGLAGHLLGAPRATTNTAARLRRHDLLARIYEVFPLICPICDEPLTFIAFLTDPEPITRILAHIGEPTSPPFTHPARGPPQTELAMGPGGGQADEVAQGFIPDDLDQNPEFDPTEPEPIPENDFDQSWDA